MYRSLGLILCLICAAPAAQAAITLTVESVSVVEGTPTTDVDISISGEPGDAFDAATFAFGVGDGGPAVGGSDIIPITAYSLNMTIFDGTPWSVDETVGPPSSSAILLNFDPNAGSPLDPNGLFLKVTLDTSGLVAGDAFGLNPNEMDLTAFANGINAIEFNGVPGELSVTAVPEPASFGWLVGVGCVVITRRKRRHR